MQTSLRALVPVAGPGAGEPLHRTHNLDAIRGKVIGFIDNAKPNFNHLVDDLAALLVAQYGAASVVKHRKTGQVPVDEPALLDLVKRCDAVITGSGD